MTGLFQNPFRNSRLFPERIHTDVAVERQHQQAFFSAASVGKIDYPVAMLITIIAWLTVAPLAAWAGNGGRRETDE